MNEPQPGKFDVVLGGTSNAPENALVLGGIEGAQQRYENPDPNVRINAISQALNYGDDGVKLVLYALATDESTDVKDVAYNLLYSKYGELIGFVNIYQAEKSLVLNHYAIAYNNRGFAYEEEKWELALADYNKAIELNPNLAEAYNNRGDVYTQQEKWDLALADYNKAIELNPNLADAYYGRGNVYYNQREWDLAVVDYTQGWDLAVADFTQAIELNPNYDLAYFSRGIIYENLEKWDLALADYTKIIEIMPDIASVYKRRGKVYRQLGDINKAREDLQRAAQLYLTRGNTAYDQQAYQEAIELLNSL